MKDSKTILKRHLALCLTLQALIVVLIALPSLDPYRAKLAELTTLPTSAFWIPLLGLLLVANILVIRRVSRTLVSPLQDLVHQTKLGTASIAFKKKSMNAEEDHLKHYIESQALRSADLEQEVVRMENEVERITELAAVSPEEFERLQDKLKAAHQAADSHASQISAEQKKAEDLEKQISDLRRELKQANRELESLQSENQEATQAQAGSISSILVEKLNTPLNLINNLAWRLAKSWADTPPNKIREGLEEISRQSEEQLELLKKYHVEEDTQQNRDAQ